VCVCVFGMYAYIYNLQLLEFMYECTVYPYIPECMYLSFLCITQFSFC